MCRAAWGGRSWLWLEPAVDSGEWLAAWLAEVGVAEVEEATSVSGEAGG